MAIFGGGLLATFDPDQGELWRTDGTSARTIRIGFLSPLVLTDRSVYRESLGAPTAYGFELEPPIVAGDHVFFIGNDAASGVELFAIENERPVAADDAATVAANASVTIAVLTNDLDPDGRVYAASARIVTQPSQGVARFNADGTLTYTAAANFVGLVSLQYAFDDHQGRVSNTATVSIQVTGTESPGGGPVQGGNSGRRGGGGRLENVELFVLLLLAITLHRSRRKHLRA